VNGPLDWRTFVDEPERRNEISAADAAEMFLSRINDRQDLHAIVTVTPERAHTDAERADLARAKGQPLPLDGMPILVKDNVDVAGYPCKVGSPLFAGRVPRADAAAIERLSAAGAVILGKATLHELVYGGTTDSPFFGRTKNPWDPGRTVGGSSGGSGAAAGAGLCVVAIGSDTGGSIRLPAHLNGVVGLRPTYGAVSTRGVVPIGPAIDTVGPLARWAADALAVHDAMVGFDWDDPHAVAMPSSEPRSITRALILGARSLGDLDPAVRVEFDRSIEELHELGITTEVRELDGFAQAREDARTVIKAEAWSMYRHDLERQPEAFSPETAERLRSGDAVTTTTLVEAQWRILQWRQSVRRLLTEYDLIALPVVPVVTPVARSEGMIAATALMTSMTLPISAAWVPAISVPTGLVERMPAGLQLVAAPDRDRDLLSLAARLQERCPLPWPSE